MKVRNRIAVTASAVFALMIMTGSADRAEAHRGGWGGIGTGIAAAIILSEVYNHHHHHRHYYYGGYPYYDYDDYPYYGGYYYHGGGRHHHLTAIELRLAHWQL